MSNTFSSYYAKTQLAGSTSRQPYQHITQALGNSQEVTFELAVSRSLLINRVSVSHPCRLRVYGSAASRLNDINRVETTAVPAGAGLYLDTVFTSDLLVVPFSPAIPFTNEDDPQNSIVYFTVENRAGSVTPIVIDFEFSALASILKPEWNLVATTPTPLPIVSGQAYIAETDTELSKPQSGSFRLYTKGNRVKVDGKLLEPYTFYEYTYVGGEWIEINFKKRPRSRAAGEATSASTKLFVSRARSSLLVETALKPTLFYPQRLAQSREFSPTVLTGFNIEQNSTLTGGYNSGDQLILPT